MIVRDVGNLLAERGRMSLRDLARHFDTDEEAMDAMLGVWMRKGRVAKRETQVCGGSCCGKSQEVMFEWCEPGQIGLVQKR